MEKQQLVSQDKAPEQQMVLVKDLLARTLIISPRWETPK